MDIHSENAAKFLGELTVPSKEVPASPAVAKAREMAENLKANKFDTIISIAFTYTEGGRWHNIDVNFREYLTILQTGMVDDKQICAVEVSDTNCDNEEGDKIKMVYDFVLLHTERNPWRMV